MRGSLAGICVLFDLDGTLVDTAEDLAAAMNAALFRDGRRPIGTERVRGLIGGGARAMLTQGLAENGATQPSAEDVDRLTGFFLEHYEAHIADHSAPFPGVIEAIGALKADGAKVAICTNKRERLARMLAAALGIENLFDAIVGPDTVGAAKPDPRPLIFCLGATGAATGVYVGDSDTDISAAAAAAMPCLLHLGGYGPFSLRAGAFATLPDYRDLVDCVRKAAF